jgi:hypothetical protein
MEVMDEETCAGEVYFKLSRLFKPGTMPVPGKACPLLSFVFFMGVFRQKAGRI